MKEHQAREYIFEEKVKKLLQDSRYISIIRGGGCRGVADTMTYMPMVG